MNKTAKIIIEDKEYQLPIIEGSQGEKALDIKKLRDDSGYITYDIGYKNTGSTSSNITFIDGEEGILHYRGYAIEELAEKAEFLEVAYLLIYGKLPNQSEYSDWKNKLTRHSLVHEDVKKVFDAYPTGAHPMGQLMTMMSMMSSFYPNAQDPHNTQEDRDLTIVRMMAKMPNLCAMMAKKRNGHPVLYPNNSFDYIENYLYMTFGNPCEPYQIDPVVKSAMNKLLILHADHEQNCSASTVRMVGSAHTNLWATIASGIAALWGPLHGGANQEVLEMLQEIKDSGFTSKQYVEKVKNKEAGVRLMGFGHRVYKNFDPRAKIIKKACDDILNKLGVKDPLLEIAKELEEMALSDSYFVERKLYPNVDFYSGIIYRALGYPTDMFTVLFALGRLPGWIAQWKEMLEDKQPISRPRQIYTGEQPRAFVDIKNR
ncbi:MAG: citrate synthase [Chitinophagales bacterium]|jgi:citrate synthase|nr:citrate synthase [Chitinophagales bacterium]